MVKRGEVRWGETPKHGRRPYLILTRNSAIGVLSEILVAPLTKAIRPIPTHVPLDESDGLPEPCAVTLDNIVMMPTGYLREAIAVLNSQRIVRSLLRSSPRPSTADKRRGPSRGNRHNRASSLAQSQTAAVYAQPFRAPTGSSTHMAHPSQTTTLPLHDPIPPRSLGS